MFWTLSFELLPQEEIIDDTDRRGGSGIKSVYSVFLTNMRVIFRFDGLDLHFPCFKVEKNLVDGPSVNRFAPVVP